MMNDKSSVKVTDVKRYVIRYAWYGIKKLFTTWYGIFTLALLTIVEYVGFYAVQVWIKLSPDRLEMLVRKFWCIAIYGGAILLDIFILYLIGKPRHAYMSEVQLIQSGFINSVGEAPILLRARTDKDNPRIKSFIFNSNGIPISEWNDRKEYIEASLNITIISISYIKGKKEIELKFVNAIKDLPEYIKWNKSYLSDEDFTLVLGIGPDGLPVKINLNKIPMVLIGGATGSGKSVLLKLMLIQALNKKAKVIISDFKGGVDFPKIWHQKCTLCFDEDNLLSILNDLVHELENRKKILKESGYPNISVYNNNTDGYMQRIIFACDEIAEVLDTRGVSKEDKEKINMIEAFLSTIARQGRAFGIHLILATQRPDANILPGQIKNNCQCKICGSCDQVLSQIVLDCADAADQIPKNIPGRLMINDNKKTIFQSYVIDEVNDILV